MDINATITLTFGTGSLDAYGTDTTEGLVGPTVGLEHLQAIAVRFPEQASLLTIDLVQYGGETNGHVLILKDMFRDQIYHPDAIFNLFYYQLPWDTRVYDRYKRMCNNVSRFKTNARQISIDAPFSTLQPIRLVSPTGTLDLFSGRDDEPIELSVPSVDNVNPLNYMTRTQYNTTKIPCLEELIQQITSWMPEYKFYCEGNAYPTGGYIGYHGDNERSFIVGGRYGATMPIQWQVFCKSKPLGEPIRLDLPHGCFYVMDTVAAGTYIKKSVPYIKHCAGHPPGIKMADPHPLSPMPSQPIQFSEVEMLTEGWCDFRPVLQQQLLGLKPKTARIARVSSATKSPSPDYDSMEAVHPIILQVTNLVASRKVAIKDVWLKEGNYYLGTDVAREVTIVSNKRRKVTFEDMTFTAVQNQWTGFSIPKGAAGRIQLSAAGKDDKTKRHTFSVSVA